MSVGLLLAVVLVVGVVCLGVFSTTKTASLA